VAKTRRFGLGERVGWLRRNDVDSEMWPEESFGGVSDEQFWDDMSSDKPLASTARPAQPDGDSRPRPEPRSARPGQSRLSQLPGNGPAPSPADRSNDRTAAQPAPQAATQAFPVAAQQASGSRTGPQPAYTGPQSAYTGPQSAYTGPQPAYTGPQSAPTSRQSAHSGPQPAYSGPQPAHTGPQTGPLPVRSATARPAATQAYPQPQPLPQYAAPAQAGPPAQSLPPTQGLPALKSLPGTGAQPASRGRHSAGPGAGPGAGHGAGPSTGANASLSAGEDPLTSDKFSVRSAPDGRSYQAARRSRDRDLSREQYDAALSQETQTFSMIDTDGGSGSYPVQPLPANGGDPRRRHANDRSYGSDSYGRDGNGTAGHAYPYSQQAPPSNTPPYGESYDDYGTRGGRASEPPRSRDIAAPRDIPARDARDGGRESYGRLARPVYPDKRGPYDPRGGDRR
jgi:hypothetical protein